MASADENDRRSGANGVRVEFSASFVIRDRWVRAVRDEGVWGGHRVLDAHPWIGAPDRARSADTWMCKRMMPQPAKCDLRHASITAYSAMSPHPPTLEL